MNNGYCTRWTIGSAECYKRKLKCDATCSNYKYCKKQDYPEMKKSVLYLFSKFNKPASYLLEETHEY